MEIQEIAKKIKENNGNLYYVGGYVRDKIMGITPKDVDLCVTGLNENKFKKLFPQAFLKGEFFPVFQLSDYEIALARKETKIADGHSGFSCNTENISIKEDLLRRDITINSMAIDVLSNELIDPFNGKKDIEEKTIRATYSHFTEDPLRAYRVAQFATRLNFEIDFETKELIKSMKAELSELSPERVFCELKKALMSSKPSIFFNILKELNILDVHFKEINDLIGITQPEKYHPEGDVYTHSMIVLDQSALMTNDIKTRFAAALHDLGKGKTPKEILPHHYGHDKNGITSVKDLCNRLKVPNSWKKLAVVTAGEHMKAGIFNQMSIAKQVSFLERNFNHLTELEIIAKADSKNCNLNFSKLGKIMMNEINGNTIKLPNNKNAKEILHQKRVEWLNKNRDLFSHS